MGSGIGGDSGIFSSTGDSTVNLPIHHSAKPAKPTKKPEGNDDGIVFHLMRNPLNSVERKLLQGLHTKFQKLQEQGGAIPDDHKKALGSFINLLNQARVPKNPDKELLNSMVKYWDKEFYKESKTDLAKVIGKAIDK